MGSLPRCPFESVVGACRRIVEQRPGGVLAVKQVVQGSESLMVGNHAGSRFEFPEFPVPDPRHDHLIAEIESAVELAAQMIDMLLGGPFGMEQGLAQQADPFELRVGFRRGAESRSI